MKSQEAEELKRLIDSFVEDDTQPVPPEELGEEMLQDIITAFDLSGDEQNKLFRGDVPSDGDYEYRFVRSGMMGDRVFMEINGNERRWVPDLETLERLGGHLNEVVDITDEEMAELKEGFGLLSVKRWND